MTERRYTTDAVQAVRTAVQMQYQLSAMADQKANLLMGASFVVFTICIAQSAAGRPLSLAMLVLGGSAFLAAILAAAAVMPVIGGESGQRNLMFFGSFADMKEDEYVEAMVAKLGDQQAFLEMMARDAYQNGRVLAAKKYRLLRAAYLLFILGLVASLAAFLVAGID